MGNRTHDVKKIVKDARRDGWTLRGGERHPSLERDGIRIPFSWSPGSDKAIIALKLRIRKVKNR